MMEALSDAFGFLSVPEANGHHQPVVPVSMIHLFLSMIPLFCYCGVSYALDLHLIGDICISSIRTFVQMIAVGYVLVPIFGWGKTHFSVVLLYLTLMILLAAYEASSRPKFWFVGQFWAILGAMVVNVSVLASFAFGIIIQPRPVYDPQYVIPISGMLLGNCITSISLALNSLSANLVEKAPEIELYLSFGATKHEATMRLLRDAIRTGIMPTLNSMAVIGLISIPGMMTGQVLGGTPPEEAAKYQILIMYLIAACCFGTVLTVLYVCLRVGFDANHALSKNIFGRKDDGQKGWLSKAFLCITAALSCACRGSKSKNGYEEIATKDGSKDGETNGARGYSDEEKSPDQLIADYKARQNTIFVRLLNGNSHEHGSTCLELKHIARSVPITTTIKGFHQSRSVSDQLTRRILFDNMCVTLKHGEIATVMGPSGAGKSQLLQLVAGLVPHDAGQLTLNGKCRSHFEDMPHWRQQVRYVTQYKIGIPGTPRMFIREVVGFTVNARSSKILDLKNQAQEYVSPGYEEMATTTAELLLEWGMEPDSLDKEWTQLSGGEAQRVIVALSIASRPQVLLLDESTSALDHHTKVLVEKSVRKYVSEQKMTALWITHDKDQATRMGLE
ncbi:hypothetical protein SARC_09305 [Sphaeroforma arctica JP610]|uniref:ABC transporter domain-containing protein n=1 Tax=Sphaeroforma arctica JP610 TaxID=667725 RepID=A0A0L0FQI0_9EUKA|nr:hypothetical protein SARC_09305 [Sphaeroforma arctica JP610]KNC78258.1 hypothetical protein SARC_09305 [Sphaeroforma arctica JP610]|eukprot:XP_014152160.1 hypothetical protein SARC_09305 [Sphaeroforma arctica JP610]